jgi:hypothetical protein
MSPSTTQHEPAKLARAVAAMAWLLVFAFGTALAASDLSNPEAAIDSAKKPLSGSPEITWYDPQTDNFRAAKVEPPAPPRNSSNPGDMNWLMWLGWVLLALLLGYMIFLLVQTFLYREVQYRTEVVHANVGGDIIARVEELPVALKKSPADYLDEAQRLYSNGDYAQAIIYLFSHQLLQLDRRHWLRLVKGKTNRQYLREVRRSASPHAGVLADLFEGTVLLFEEVFFGKRLPHKADIDAVWQKIGQFEALVIAVEERAA